MFVLGKKTGSVHTMVGARSRREVICARYFSACGLFHFKVFNYFKLFNSEVAHSV